MKLRITLGINDFRKLRECGIEYVDKTHFITEFIDNDGAEVTSVDTRFRVAGRPVIA